MNRIVVVFRTFLRAARVYSVLFVSVFLAVPSTLLAKDIGATGKATKQAVNYRTDRPSSKLQQESEAEAKLIQIYQLIGAGQNRQALQAAELLVKAQPNFQLAQLVHADLLSSFIEPAKVKWQNPSAAMVPAGAAATLADLREESQQRLKALREKPPVGTLPSQFLTLSSRNKHAIAVDASRSRLYLFENTVSGVHLVGDYYISVGKLGIEKLIEGDQRTPLGVYFITNNIDPKTLKDFYGAGALPINYPNPLDVRRGKTGSGIWLHGTPSDQFSRAPKATDGCVVLANTDLNRIMRTVGIRTTPVVIAEKLQWVTKQSLATDSAQFNETLQAWRTAKSKADFPALIGFYWQDFSSYGKNLVQWAQVLGQETVKFKEKGFELAELSIMRWTDKAETMVVTFDEIPAGAGTGTGAVKGVTKRQYWMREGKSWKIFFEGAI